MSKEQTPIEYVSGIVISAYDHKVKNDRIINAVEKAINVAVLEVLERYQNKLSEGYNRPIVTGKLLEYESNKRQRRVKKLY